MTRYLRYRVDASRDLGSDRLHTAEVAQEWHDTEDDAIEYAHSMIEDDPDLILTVGEYAISATEQPTYEEWAALAAHSPLCETEVRS